MAQPSKRLIAARLLLRKRREIGGSMRFHTLHLYVGLGLPADEQGLLKVIAEEEKQLAESNARETQQAELARQRKIEEDRHEAQMRSMREEEHRKREEWELFKRQKELELRMREAELRRLENPLSGGLDPGNGFDDYGIEDL